MNTNHAVLIVGGYGVVGNQVAKLIRQRHPDLPLIIAGRNIAKAEALAHEVINATAKVVNVETPNPLNGMLPRVVLAITNDPKDYLLKDAIKANIPFIDITRWTDRMRSAISVATTNPLHSPVMLSSSWMAGIAAIVAVGVSKRLRQIDRIDISVLYSLKDKAGPNSAEYMDRLATPFEVMLNGSLKKVYPCTDPRKIFFPGGYTAKAYRFDTPDQVTLPTITGAKTVAARIAYDNTMATNFLIFLTRSGIWKLISGKLFTSFRRSLLYNPGSGAKHEIVIEISGVDENGCRKNLCASIVDPEGQTHLTAVSTLIQVERLLGLDGAEPPKPGIMYPESFPQMQFVFKTLKEHNIAVSLPSEMDGNNN